MIFYLLCSPLLINFATDYITRKMKRFFSTLTLAMAAILGGCTGSQGIRSMNNEDFAAAIADTSSVILIDVRTPEEFAAGHIPGAVNIDVQSDDFRQKIQELDRSKTAAVYCRSGVRSMNASRILVLEGFKVYNLKKGFLGWDGPETGSEDGE